jgi:hypothetical protein
VLVPGYLPILLWAVPVIVFAQVLRPRGLVDLGAFCGAFIVAFWLALWPMLRRRWRDAIVAATP